jgi:hypothetical protein
MRTSEKKVAEESPRSKWFDWMRKENNQDLQLETPKNKNVKVEG